MKQLIYMSRANRDFSNSELDELLNLARQRNTDRGVTGMLVYASRAFLQVLEGPPSKVDDLYRKVYNDTRHRNVLILKELTVSTRCFPNWTMGFKRLSKQDYAPKAFFELTQKRMSSAISSGASEELIKFITGFGRTRISA